MGTRLIAEILNDYRGVLEKAAEPVRTYNKKSPNIYKPEQARYKLVIWFKDGNRRIYYSYDHQYHNKEKHLDENQSLVKLMRLIDKHYQDDKITTAIIYATIDKDRKITSDYCYEIFYLNLIGKGIKNSSVNFKVNGKDNYLDLDHLSLYGNKKVNR